VNQSGNVPLSTGTGTGNNNLQNPFGNGQMIDVNNPNAFSNVPVEAPVSTNQQSNQGSQELAHF
jgi:hypothetical protein